MTKSHKKPTIQREEQRHNPLLLFPLEGEWLTRGRGIPSTAKARDKIATLLPTSWENCDPDGAQTEGGVFHYLDTQPFREGIVEAGSGGTRVFQPNGMNRSSSIPH